MGLFNPTEHADKIVTFSDCLPEHKRFIELIEQSNDSDHIDRRFVSKWKDWNASNADSYGNRDIDSYGMEMYVSSDMSKLEPGEKPLDAKTLYIVNTLKANMHFAATQYKKMYNIEEEVKLDKEFGIKKYFVGKALGDHADQYDGNMNLRYSIVFYLNDDYEGGELNFKNHQVTVKPRAGTIAIFPSSEPYLHASLELKSGVKYMCPGFWIK